MMIPEFDDPNPPEESSNRHFCSSLEFSAGLSFLRFFVLVGIFSSEITPTSRLNDRDAQVTQQQATVQAGVTQTAIAQNQTQTAAVTNTVPPTNTPVIAEATATSSPTSNPATATVAAAFTQLAVSTQTIIPTSTALPNTGFADEFGASGLMLVALASSL